MNTVREAFLHGQIGRQHTPHHVRTASEGFIFDAMMEVSGEMEVPQALCPATLSELLDASLGVPITGSRPSRTHLCLDLDAVIMFLSDSATESTVVLISKSPLGEDGSVRLECTSLCTIICTANVTPSGEMRKQRKKYNR